MVLAVWQSGEDDAAPDVVRARLESTVETFNGRKSLGYGEYYASYVPRGDIPARWPRRPSLPTHCPRGPTYEESRSA